MKDNRFVSFLVAHWNARWALLVRFLTFDKKGSILKRGAPFFGSVILGATATKKTEKAKTAEKRDGWLGDHVGNRQCIESDRPACIHEIEAPAGINSRCKIKTTVLEQEVLTPCH